MARDILMGIDAGTGSIRVGLFDLTGHEIAFYAEEYETIYPHPGWAEQRPEDWWSALKISTVKAMEKAGVTKDRILALALDTTCCTVVLSKEDGTAVRNCLLWMDVRSADDAKIVDKAAKESKENTYFGPTIAEAMPCKLLWLKKNERALYDEADVFSDCQEWMMHKITGRWEMNTDQASARWYYDAKNRRFPRDLYEAAGIGDAIEKFPKAVVAPGDNAGKISAFAAKELSLDEETIVVHGGVDGFIGVAGMGVYDTSKLTLITGSSHIIMAYADHPYKPEKYGGPKMDGTIKGLGLIDAGQTSSGSIVSWFKNNFTGDLVERGKKEGKSVYDYLNEEASAIPAGSEGLLVLDWWQGNRAPYADTDIRGMIYGLSLNHTRGHIFRAIMEGVAYGTENNFDSIREDGIKVEEVIVSGGVTNSDLFLQIHADVSGVVMKVPEQIQSPTLGCAIWAAVGSGIYKDIKEACDNMVRYKKVVEPNMENHAKYKKIFAQYKKAYPLFKDWMHDVSSISLIK